MVTEATIKAVMSKMGQKGGSSTSEAKRTAARANGKKNKGKKSQSKGQAQ